jgi:hypothetical protein
MNICNRIKSVYVVTSPQPNTRHTGPGAGAGAGTGFRAAPP